MDNKEDLCEIVQDILPLYVDGICSASSRKMIKNHLAECDSCKEELRRLQDMEVVEAIEKERNMVLQHHAKKERTAAWKAGIIIAVLLFIPVMITSILTAAGKLDIGTVLVLTSAMILTGAFIVIPLLSKNKKFAKMILVSTGAIVLIELFMSIFFNGGSFIQIAVPTIFGISVVFFPFVVKSAELPEFFANQKSFLVMCWDTLWLYLTILAITLVEQNYKNCKTGMVVSTFFIIFAWVYYFILRNKSLNSWRKAGLIAALSGFIAAFANDVIQYVLEGKSHIQIIDVNFSDWTKASSLNANICLIALAVMVIIGVILWIIGTRRK